MLLGEEWCHSENSGRWTATGSAFLCTTRPTAYRRRMTASQMVAVGGYCVHRQYWTVAWKRHLTLELTVCVRRRGPLVWCAHSPACSGVWAHTAWMLDLASGIGGTVEHCGWKGRQRARGGRWVATGDHGDWLGQLARHGLRDENWVVARALRAAQRAAIGALLQGMGVSGRKHRCAVSPHAGCGY